jgi:hypothetical protein
VPVHPLAPRTQVVAFSALLAGAAVGVVAVVLAATAARAQPFDHLQCYKVKASSRMRGKVDTTPLESQLPAGFDCRVKGPVLFCAPVTKQSVSSEPPAPGAPDGPEEREHLCYKVRCKLPDKPAPVATDQFGTFELAFRRSELLCVPAVQGGPIPCGESDAPQCSGACPDGQVCTSFPGKCVSGSCGSSSIVCGSDSICSALCGGVCSFSPFCECTNAP